MSNSSKRKLPRSLPVPLKKLVGPFKTNLTGVTVKRGLYFSQAVEKGSRTRYDASTKNDAVESVPGVANLVGSKLHGHDSDDMHLPILDLDYDAYLIPSATKGHNHLYLQFPLKWSEYQKLLKVMAEIGLIETGYYRASLADGQSFARIPTYQDLYEQIELDFTEGTA